MREVKGIPGDMLIYFFAMTTALASAGKSWSKDHDHGNLVDTSGETSHLERLEVVCSKDHMTVHMHFDQPFYGVVFSHGSERHQRCVHVGPRAGITSASFDIRYDGCGTVEHLGGRFHENTVVIQFDEEILEAWDQAKRLRCEWLENFEKPSSKPTLAISDLDTVELNFQGDDIDCWMEVQEGKGPWARQVGGLVPIGSPLTLVIAINDHSKEFDMRIKRCTAGDGRGSEIELTDDYGCVVRHSLLTPFAKVRDFGGKATLVAYSHLYAFKFPDKMDVFVHCIVEVCRHGCKDTCIHQNGDHQYSGGVYDSLESKKIQKLKELSGSKFAHESVASGHQETLGSVRGYPIPGEILIPAAQKQVHRFVSKNSSFDTEVISHQKGLDQRPTFKPLSLIKKTTVTKSEIKSESSNAQGIYVDVSNNLHTAHNSKLGSQSYQPESHSHSQTEVHRIIGHDIHYIADVSKGFEKPQSNPQLPLLKDISYVPPQPEPATWSGDDVKPLTKHDVFHSQQPSKLELETNVHHHLPTFKDISHEPPQPEPAAWSADDVKPLTKHDVYHSQTPSKLEIDTNVHRHLPTLKDIYHEPPQPELAAWSADDVKPLTKHDVYHSQPPSKLVLETSIHPQPPKIHWVSGNAKSPPSVHLPAYKNIPGIPQPEPATWKLEEVNPMHSPKANSYQSIPKEPDVPKPEPASWTLQDAKGLSKEDLRILSLNHKMKVHPQIIAPIYKEAVHPFTTTTIPQPAYISRYPLNSRNISNPNMMKMRMIMSTMLPPTYQTAHWPQRTTARYLRPQKQHYPYPIPQFSPHQQMMMSVIADRRMDGENETITTTDGNVSLHHNLNSEENPGSRRIGIGETISSEALSKQDASSAGLGGNEQIMQSTDMSKDGGSEGRVMIGEVFDKNFKETSTRAEVLATETTASEYPSQSISTEESQILEGASDVRPPVSGFVPPSLDEKIGASPESKDRPVPGPRALERKKRSSEPIFGVQQKFQAIAPSDLAYEWNLTSESPSLLKGIREEIVYGICVSPVSLSTGVGFILILTLLSTIVSVVLYEQSCVLSKKTSQLSFLTRNFNGQIEALYKITRPYLYTSNQNVR